MRITTKRVISVFLVLCMVLSLLPTISFAASVKTLTASDLNLQSSVYPHPFSTDGLSQLNWPDLSGATGVYQSYWQTEDGFGEAYNSATAEPWAVNGKDSSHPNAFVATNSAPCDDNLGDEDPNYSLYTYSYSCMSYEFMGDATISFDWRASCEDFDLEGYAPSNPDTCLWDSFLFIIDGEVKIQTGNDTGWQHFGAYEVTGEPTDSHVLAWIYTKDAGYGQHEDCAFVDNIQVEVDNSVRLSASDLDLQSSLIPHPFSTAGEAMLTWDESPYVLDTYSQSDWAHEEYPSYYADYDLATPYAWETVAYDAEHPTALKSTNTDNEASYTYSAMSYTFSGPTTLAFDYLLSFESCDDETNTACDSFELIVDNHVVLQTALLADEAPAWKNFSYEITGNGEHNVIWVFNQDFFVAGTDTLDCAVYVDNITVEVSGACDLSSAKLTYQENGIAKELTENGGNLSYDAGSVSNLCVQFADDGETTYILKVDGEVVTPVGGVYSIPRADKAHKITLTAMRPGFMAATWSCSTEAVFDLDNIIIEAPAGATYALVNDAAYPWIVLPNPTGGAMAQSGNTGVDSSTATLTLNVTVPAGKTYYLVYDYAASTESASWDYMKAYDGSTEILGPVGGCETDSETFAMLQLQSSQIALSAGQHQIKWSYTKDSSVAKGCDAAYIMNVRIRETQLDGTLDLSYNSAMGSVKLNNSVVSGTISGYATSGYTLVATPAAQCYFAGWFIDDTLVSNEFTYSGVFGNAPSAIEARFDSAATTTLTANWDSHISGVTCSVNGGAAAALTSGTAINVQQGDIVTLNAAVASGYFMGVYHGDVRLSATPAFTFTLGAEDVSLTYAVKSTNDFVAVPGCAPANLSVYTRPQYAWSLDAEGSLMPGNKGVGGSVGILKIIPAESGILSYTYRASSETNFDCLYYSNVEITNTNFESADNYEDRGEFSGIVGWTTRTIAVQKDVPVYFAYRKDTGVEANEDLAWIKDFSLTTDIQSATISTTFDATIGGVTKSGIAITSGEPISYPLGTSCTLVAAPTGVAFFEGWYNGDVLCTADPSYTFTVTGDANLTARFNANSFTDIPGFTPGTGIASVQTRARYPWTNANGTLTSGNATVATSVSSMRITAAQTGMLSLDYKTSSEPEWDVLFYFIGTEVTTENFENALNYADRANFSGAMENWATLTIPVNAGDVIYLGYCKDTSRDGDSDIAQIRNVRIATGTVSVTPTSSNTTYGTVSGGGTELEVGATTTVTATPAAGGQFYGWVANGAIVSNNATYTFPVTGEMNLTAIFAAAGSYVAKKSGDSPAYFTSLTDAFAASVNGDCIRLLENVTVNEDLTVPAGVTFLIPYSAADNTGYAEGNGSNAINRPSWTQESRFLYRTVTIAAGKTLTVNGTMIIGAVQHYPDQSSQGHTSGAYSQVVCNGSLVVNGSLVNYGLMKGSGTTTVKNGATLKTPFLVTSYSGGTNTNALYDANSFPFTQFATINVQDSLVVEGGANVVGMTSLYFNGSVTTQEINLIGKTAGLILLPVGSTATLTYDANVRVNQSATNLNLSDFGKTTITISGGATAGLFDVSGYGSGSMYLNIPYTFDLVLTNGTYTMSRLYRIMPGASVTVADGATLNVTGGLQVTDGWQQADKSGKLYPSTAELANSGLSKSGTLIVNGTLNVTGTFGGIVQTTAPANASVILAPGAMLAESFTGGCSGGYTDDSVSYSLPARAWVDGTLTNLTAGTYYGADTASHTLESYTMTASRISGTVVTVNQPMNGTWSQPGITFESNGGSAVAAINGAAGSTISSPAAPTKVGYTFAGWYANAELSGNAFEFTTMPRVATKLFAKWTANTYTVTFNANGGEGTMAAQTHTYDADLALTANTFTRAGYSFAGWKSADSTAYTDGQSIRNLTAENGAEIMLYAQWTANTYTVTLNPNGGALNAGVATELTVTFGNTYGDIPTPRRNGFDFAGWYLGESQITAASTVATAENHTLTAHWNEIAEAQYSVYHYTEDLDGEYSQYKKQTFYGVPGATVTAAALSIPGFTYYPEHEYGWATDEITVNGRMFLDMYYTRNSYTVSYMDGAMPVLTEDTFKFEAALNLQSYAKAGFTFDGWFTDAELTEAAPAEMPASNLTLYAKLTPIGYTVTYISDGDTIHTAEVVCDAAIPAYTPEKTGYHFVGWYTEDTFENAAPATMPANALTLYAKWEKNSYMVTIQHQYNGTQIHEDTTQSVAYLDAVTDPVLAIGGYYFTEGSITPAADTQITADTVMTVSYNSYLDDLLAIDSATFSDDAVLASARALYAQLNELQKADYSGTEHQTALFAAIKAYSETQLKAAVHAAVTPTNAALANTDNEYIDETVATLEENDQIVDVSLVLPDYLASNMLYIDFLTELFSYEEIRSIQIDDLADYVLTGTTVAQNPANSDQFKLMFNIAWTTLYPEGDENTVRNYLMDNKDTLKNSELDGKSITATVNAITAEGVAYSVPYQIHFAVPKEEVLEIVSAALVLNGKIDVAFNATIPEGYTDARMVFDGPNGAVTVNEYTVSDETCVFTYTGINPQCMGDGITATLFATKDGTEESVCVNYSVRQYCTNKLADENISAELRTLLSDMLAYGAAAQTYMSYKTDASVNVGEDIVNPTYSTFADLTGFTASFDGTAAEDIRWVSAGLTLTNSVAMTFRFYAASIDGLTVRVSINGRVQEFTEFTAVDGKEGYYEVSFTGIGAAEFGDSVSASFYNGETQVGNTVSYSVNAYVQSKQADSNASLAALVKALYNYGAAAKAFAD